MPAAAAGGAPRGCGVGPRALRRGVGCAGWGAAGGGQGTRAGLRWVAHRPLRAARFFLPLERVGTTTPETAARAPSLCALPLPPSHPSSAALLLPATLPAPARPQFEESLISAKMEQAAGEEEGDEEEGDDGEDFLLKDSGNDLDMRCGVSAQPSPAPQSSRHPRRCAGAAPPPCTPHMLAPCGPALDPAPPPPPASLPSPRCPGWSGWST